MSVSFIAELSPVYCCLVSVLSSNADIHSFDHLININFRIPPSPKASSDFLDKLAEKAAQLETKLVHQVDLTSPLRAKFFLVRLPCRCTRRSQDTSRKRDTSPGLVSLTSFPPFRFALEHLICCVSILSIVFHSEWRRPA